MNLFKKHIFLFSLLAVLSAPGFSSAEITFQSSPSSQSISPSGILDNLPQPISDFIKSVKDIGNMASDQFGKYINTSALQSPVNINLNQLKDVNVTQWFQNISQNGFFGGLYQIVAKVLSLVGNLFVWILNIVTELIRQGLALLH